MTQTLVPELALETAPPRRSLRPVRRILLKLLGSVFVLWAAATFTFAVQALLPGDRATLLLNLQTGQTIKRSAAELAPINTQFGFDDPVFLQYLHYVGGLARGDLGTSYQLHQPVTELIAEQVTPTIALTVTALVVAWLLAVVWTVATARRGPLLSGLGSAVETVTAGLPHYWLGVILLVVFAVTLQWFPVGGGDGLWALTLPALTLGIPLAGFLGQVTRDEFVQVLEQPFVTTARTRGMSDLGVRTRHVLRHAVLPAITLSGWALGALVSGAVIAENIFGRPGIGQVLVTAVNTRDLPTVSGIVLVVAAIYVLANLLVDLAYAVVDPRLSPGRAR
jgi:peptide/nickel transport system permease protein